MEKVYQILNKILCLFRDVLIALVILEFFALGLLVLAKVTNKFSLSVIPDSNIKFSRYDLPHPLICCALCFAANF